MVFHHKICADVYQIGDSELTHPSDCSIYMVCVGYGEFVMIDCGSGERESFEKIVENIKSIGYDPSNLKALILTHCHIDHIGAASDFKSQFNCMIIAHELDSEAIEGHDKTRTAASWYGVKYKPVPIDKMIHVDFEKYKLGEVDFNIIHTPGHTPGSISVYCDMGVHRVLFGQDIHGPFDESFGSDIYAWKKSMVKLLDLDADILCEGHYGVFKGKMQVKDYIKGYLDKYAD
jgi:glyoxylase-like metal-dependent hydrolase (beta-lactamase superfamily II)